MLGHILQITSLIPNRLHNPLPGPLLDLRRQPLQHCLQAALPRLLRLHHLPHDHEIQAHPRPEPRHLPGAIPARRLRRARHPLPLQMDLLRDNLGLLNLARVRRDPTTTVPAAEDWRGRDDYDSLPVRARELPGVVHPELDLSVFWGGTLGAD
jgi:hypothetical protein